LVTEPWAAKQRRSGVTQKFRDSDSRNYPV
jgi:hypothetical protein